MLKIFDRYILKEIIPPFIIGLLICSFVLLMNQILVLSEMFIARGIPFGTILALLAYLIPSVLAFTVPMSVLMGIMAGLSRMSSDSEITALKTLGVSHKRLLSPVIAFSIAGFLVTTFLTLYIAPQANFKWVQTLSRSVLAKVQFKIKAREFNEGIPNAVIFIQDIKKEDLWENIFIYLSESPEEPQVVYAKKGKINFYEKERKASLELFEGALHSYVLSDPEKYRVTSFKSLEKELNVENFFSSIPSKKGVRQKDIKELLNDSKFIKKELEAFPESMKVSQEFWKKNREYISHRIEVQKKFALPFSCLIFAFLGIALGASTKKGGKTSGFTISIGLVLIYYILITAGENVAMDFRISPFLGMWGPNILFLLGSLYFFARPLEEASLLSSFSLLFKGKKEVFSSEKRKKFVRTRPRFSLKFPNIIDRYLTRKYLYIFILVFISLLIISFIVTFFERVDNIYKHNQSLSFLFEFIWYNIPEFIHYILPVTALTTALLSLGILNKFNEITAMKACGISLYRIIVPVLLLGALASVFSFYLQEGILPYSNRKAEETWNKINEVPPRSYTYLDRRWVLSRDKNRIYYYKYFDPAYSIFSQISIYDIDPASWSLKRRIYSDKGYLKDKNLFLTDCWYRNFENGETVKFERKEQMELAPVEEKSYFLKKWKEPDQMNYRELKAYIAEIEEGGFETVKFKVDLNYKVSFPFACLIMTLIGIPFAFSMGKRGTLVGIGLSLMIAIVYWGAIGIFKSLGYIGYLSAFLAAWGPNLIFGLAGLYMIFTLRT